MSEWISVKERLPEYGERVLVVSRVADLAVSYVDTMSYDPEEGICPEGWYTDDGWPRKDDEVTHWQPLPEPPGEEGE